MIIHFTLNIKDTIKMTALHFLGFINQKVTKQL